MISYHTERGSVNTQLQRSGVFSEFFAGYLHVTHRFLCVERPFLPAGALSADGTGIAGGRPLVGVAAVQAAPDDRLVFLAQLAGSELALQIRERIVVDALDARDLHPKPRSVGIALTAGKLREGGVDIGVLVELSGCCKGEVFLRCTELVGIACVQLDGACAAELLQLLEEFPGVYRLVCRRFLKDPGDPLKALPPRLFGVDGVARTRLRFARKRPRQIDPRLCFRT